MPPSTALPTPAHTPPPSVLHVVDSLERGGLERLVNDLAIAQHQAGWNVAVFSINDTQGYRQCLEDAGVPVIVGHKQGTLDMQVLKLLRHTLKSTGIRTVHAHNFVPSYYAAIALIGLRPKVAQVVTCHDMGTRLNNRRLRALFKWSVGRSQRIAMVGRQVFERFVSTGIVPASKACTVLNAVPIDHFVITPDKRSWARQALGLASQDLVVGCVGRLVELKNHATLIKLWPDVLRARPDARLVLIGDGPLRDTLQKLAFELGVADHIVFAGLRENVAQLLPALDIFALPSLTEGVSIALLEAMATGLPSLASKVGGNIEVIEHGQTGLLFDLQEGQALRQALMALVGDEALRAQLARQARTWTQTNASLNVLTTRYASLYGEAHEQLR
ncbi:MAG: glycosyltransferase [Aquabacterium sp.]|nr:glycosyltransferase [Aquabacterium sp.]